MIGEKCGVGGHDFMSNRDLLDVKVNLPRGKPLFNLIFLVEATSSIFPTVHLWFNGVGKAEWFPVVARHG